MMRLPIVALHKGNEVSKKISSTFLKVARGAIQHET